MRDHRPWKRPRVRETPPDVGGLTRGGQGGTQIVLLGRVDLVAGNRVQIVGQKDSSHVVEPRRAGVCHDLKWWVSASDFVITAKPGSGAVREGFPIRLVSISGNAGGLSSEK